MTTRYFGASIARNEDRRLLTGRALFVNDVERPGMLHVAFLRSPHAHARLGTVDLSRVRERPGVVAAYAADDLGNYWKPGPLLVPPPPIEGTIFNQRSALGERQRWQALSNLPHAGGTANSNPSSSSGESCKPSVPRRVARCGGAQSISAESRLEIRRPTSAGAELPDQGSVFCERWCARRRRGQTVRRWVLKFGLAIARRLRKHEPTSSSPRPALLPFLIGSGKAAKSKQASNWAEVAV